MNKKYTLLPLLTATLVACGGGGTPSPANEKPMVSLKRADGSVITTTTYLGAGDRIIVSSSDADGNITKVQWKIDDKAGEFSGTDVKSRLELPLTGLSNGTHTAEVTVTDNAGATATTSTTFNVDAVAPAISKITLNGTQVASGSTTNLTIGDAASLTVTATDSRGTEAAAASPATIRIMEGTSVRATGTDTVTADLSKAADGKDRAAGPVTFTIIAKDSAGNSTASTATLNFIAAGEVDNTKPTFSWLSPSADYVPGNSTVNVRATATRSGSEVKEAIVYTATCGTVVNGNWNTAGCEDGSKQVVTATVTIGGKAYSDTKTVTVDASAPTVQITSPNTGTEVTVNPVKVNLTATDAVSGVATVVLEASRDGGAFEQVGVLTTASGEITWAPSNGSYTLRATATDRTGNRNTTTVTGINVKLTSSDKTAPTVNGLEILNKAASGVERGTVTAQVTATDADSGVAKVELFDGGTSLGVQTAGVGGKYTFTLDTTKLSDGAHTLRAVATDNVGLSSQTSLTIQTDNTAPAVTWLSPTDGSMVGGTVNLNATTNEGTVEYTVDGEKVTGTSYTFKADGAHTITASATDKAGNTTTSTIKVTSDATAPTAQITTPAQGATITSNPVTVSVSGSDSLSGVKSLEVFANGTSIGTVNGESGTVTWAPQSGDYALTVIATDKAGNRSAAGTPVNVKMQLATADTTRPVFLTTPTLQPAPQNGLSRGNVVVDGNVTDAETGISTVALFDGGLRLSATPSLSKNPDGSTRYAFTLDTRTLNDGPHTLVVQATNSVGLTENKEVAFNIDNTAPVLTWNAQSFVGPAGSLALDASSESGAAVTYTTTCGSISGNTWNYKDCADGVTATLTATATDPAGNTTNMTRTITVDMSAPTVQITSPQDGQTFTANPVKVSLSAADAVSGIKKVTLEASRDGGAFEPVGELTTASGDLTWVPGNGTYTLRATAIDRSGQTATKFVNKLVVKLTSSDIAPPTVDAFNVPAGSQRGMVTLTVAASDPAPSSGLAKVELFEGSTSLGVQTSGVGATYTFSVDTNKLSDGAHNLRAVATDNVGLSSQKEMTLITDNTAPVLTWNAPSIVGASGTLLLDAVSNEGEVTYATSCGEVVGKQWNYSTCADGATAVLTASAKDAAGNVTVTTRSITVDKSAPTVQITSPQAGQKFTSNPITVNVTATDNIGVDSIEVYVNEVADDKKIGTVTGNQGSLTWAPSSGKYTLIAVATDRARNTSTQDTKSVEVSLTTSDTTPPEMGDLKIESEPFDGIYRGTVTAVVSAIDEESGVAKVELFDGGTSLGMQTVGVGGKYTFTVDTTRLSDGSHNLRAVATNNAGSSRETTQTIKVDNASPVVVWQSLKDGSLVRGTVTLQANTDKGVLTYTVDGKLVAAGSHTFVVDGVHTLTAMSTYAGKTTTSTITVTSDATAPSAQIITPTTDQKFTSAPVNVEVRALDTGTGVTDISVYALPEGGTEELVGTLKASGSLPWYPTKTDGTPYTLRVVATDRVGNANDSSLAGASAANITVQTASNITFNQEVSLAKPTTEPVGGLSGKYVRGPLIVSANATTNAVSGMKLAELLIDGAVKAAEADSQNNPTFNFDFDTLNDGTHNVAVRFTDNVGTVRVTKTDVYVDKTAPVITWNTPSNGDLMKGMVKLDTTVVDPPSPDNTFVPTFYVDGSSVKLEDADVNTEGFQWDANQVDPGTHVLTALARDRLGNEGRQSITFTVVSQPTVKITNTADLSGKVLSGYISVKVNAADKTPIDRVELYVNGGKVASVVPTSPDVTFPLNTADYPNGPVKLYARAVNTSGEATKTEEVAFQVTNRVAPVLAISAPANGSLVTTPLLPVQLTVTKRNNSDFYVQELTYPDPTDPTKTVTKKAIRVDLLDSRGARVVSKYVEAVDNKEGVYRTTDFDLAALPADDYTIQASMNVRLTTDASAQGETVGQTINITTRNQSSNPPASVISMPVQYGASREAPTINRDSATIIQVSDDKGIKYVQVRFTNPDGTPINAYLLNASLNGVTGPITYMLPTVDIDSSQYVPDGNFKLRVTVEDTDGNRNVQEIPVIVKRSARLEQYVAALHPAAYNDPTDYTPKALQHKSAVWKFNCSTDAIVELGSDGKPTGKETLPSCTGLTSKSRIIAVVLKDDVVIQTDLRAETVGENKLDVSFTGAGTYRVDWIVEDLTTGLTQRFRGDSKPVIQNPGE